jgi:hypothetical protein
LQKSSSDRQLRCIQRYGGIPILGAEHLPAASLEDLRDQVVGDPLGADRHLAGREWDQRGIDVDGALVLGAHDVDPGPLAEVTPQPGDARVGRVRISTPHEHKSNQYVLGEHVAIITELLV